MAFGEKEGTKAGEVAKGEGAVNAGQDGVTVKEGHQLSSPLRPPARRHVATGVNQRTVAKNVNTVIEPGVDVAGDVAAINKDQATRVGNTYTINGRTYGVHNSTLYPISGPGLHQLHRGAFKALGVYNQFGNTPRASSILDNMGISAADRAAALRACEASRRA